MKIEHFKYIMEVHFFSTWDNVRKYFFVPQTVCLSVFWNEEGGLYSESYSVFQQVILSQKIKENS